MTAQYPLNPGTFSATTLQYFGFQTRPGKAASATNILDAAHPATGDCSSCHSRTDYFEGNLKPSNHIPTSATATCANCHKSGDFSVIPALIDIHTYAPSTTSNCVQCHGTTTAPTFAIPAANFSIVTMPANHVPTTAACESCHVGAGSSVAATPVPNGAKFTNSAMNHAGLTTCVGCHGPTVTNSSFYGITSIIVMPATSPQGPSAHIPSGTACESCHLASMPAGLVPGVATHTIPGSLFQAPAPTTAQIHTGITANCASCHEGAYNWVDMTSQYPLNPATFSAATVQYYGFQTRPGKAASTTNLLDAAHPATGDCSSCHSRTDYFEGQLKPSNHIPTSATATCTNCHKSTDFSVLPALIDIHTNAPSTTTNCAQCHGPTTAPTFAIPAANFTIVTTPANHIPTTAACESCHVGPASSVAATPVPNGAKFTNSAMNHAGITTCVSCHGPTIELLVRRRHEDHRDAGNDAGRRDLAHPVVDDVRDLPPRDDAVRTDPGRLDPLGPGEPVPGAGADDGADPYGHHGQLRDLPRGRLQLARHDGPVSAEPGDARVGHGAVLRLPDAPGEGRKHHERAGCRAADDGRLLDLPRAHRLFRRPAEAR